MPRVNKVETCIFCGDTPCTCNDKVKAEPKPRKPRKTAAPKSQPVVEGSAPPVHAQKTSLISIQDAMRAAAKTKAKPRILSEVTEAMEDTELVLALQAVGPLMAAEDKIKWQALLDKEVTPQERAALWKERNRCKP